MFDGWGLKNAFDMKKIRPKNAISKREGHENTFKIKGKEIESESTLSNGWGSENTLQIKHIEPESAFEIC